VDLSICIITHNQPALLGRCVAACIGEIGRSQLGAEIIIVDNASDDAYPQRLACVSPIIRIIRNDRNLGFSAANNQAIRASHGRCVLILNDDTALQADSLALMLGMLDSDRRAGAVGPRLLNLDGSLQRGFTNRRFPHLRGVLCQTLGLEGLLERNRFTRDVLTMCRSSERTDETGHVAGACLLARRKALDAIGLFDEGFQYWFEDVDLCYRLKEAGWRVIYVAEARVTHYKSSSFKELTASAINAIYFRSLRYYFRKHSGSLKYLLVRSVLALVIFLRMSGGILYKAGRRSFSEQRASIGRSLRVVWSLLSNQD
jgi:N-acetylglucosaminyl-diphospho-decaprenol L-rhamnosyltransferase